MGGTKIQERRRENEVFLVQCTVDVGKRRCEFEIYFGREKYCYVSGVSRFV